MGSSEWCTLDYDTRMPRKSSSVCYPSDMVHREDESGAGAFVRVKEKVSEDDYVYTYRSMFVDIDSNKHTNNVAYVRMALDTFSPEEFSSLSHSIKEVAIAFYLWFNNKDNDYHDINIENVNAIIPEWEKEK